MEWISISEQLPNPKGEWVLVCADGAQNCLGYSEERGFYDWCGSARTALNVNIDQITHWMPLPPSPETDLSSS